MKIVICRSHGPHIPRKIAPIALSLLVLGVGACSGHDAPANSKSSGTEVFLPTPAGVQRQPLSNVLANSNAQKSSQILDILETWVNWAEGYWVEDQDPNDPDRLTKPKTGHFVMPGWGVMYQRALGDTAVAYATLLKGRPSATEFVGDFCNSQSQCPGTMTCSTGRYRISRTKVLDHAVQSIRYSGYTNLHYVTETPHVDGMRGEYGGTAWGGDIPWGHPGDQHALEAVYWLWAAQILWNDLKGWDSTLGPDTKTMVSTIGPLEAGTRLLANDSGGGPIPDDMVPGIDTAADPDSWNVMILASQAAMWPTHANNAQWKTQANALAIAASAVAADATSSTLIDGTALSSWVDTGPLNDIKNLNDDLTLDNHGFFHPSYLQGTFDCVGEASAMYAYAGMAIPQAFDFRLAEVWDKVLAPHMLDDADLLHPFGTDWVRHDYQHLLYLTTLASRLQRADASVYESRALEQLRVRQLWTGSLYGGQADGVGYESDVIKGLAFAYWTHQYLPATPQPTQAQFDMARAASEGQVKNYPSQLLDVYRTRQAAVSVGMDTTSNSQPAVQVIPSGTPYLSTFPTFAAFRMQSGMGNFGEIPQDSSHYYSNHGSSNVLSVAAINADASRKYAINVFQDGTTLLMDIGSGPTFNFSFEVIPYVTDDPYTVSYSGGSASVGWDSYNQTLSSPWVNVAGRFGMVVRGGSGIKVYTEVDGRELHAIDVTGTHDASSVNRVALVMPLASATTTSSLSSSVVKLTVPTAWSGMVARSSDNADYLAVARLGGAANASITVPTSTGRGVPVHALPAGSGMTLTVNGTPSGTLSTTAAPGAPWPMGSKTRFFLTSSSGQTANVNLVSEARAIVQNVGPGQNTVSMKYEASNGIESTASRTLNLNDVAIASPTQGLAITLPFASSSAGSGFEPYKAYDGTASYGWKSASTFVPTTHPEHIGVDFGKTVQVGRVVVKPAPAGGTLNMPKTYVVETSTDGINYTARVTETNIPCGLPRTSVIPGIVDARWVRVRVTDGYTSTCTGVPTSMYIAELQVVPRATAFASTSHSSPFTPDKAYDNNVATHWDSAFTFHQWTHPEYLGLDFGSSYHMSSVTVNGNFNSPKTYGIEVSDDNTSWTQIALVPLQANSSTLTTDFEPQDKRYIRIMAYDAYDTQSPPRNPAVLEISAQ